MNLNTDISSLSVYDAPIATNPVPEESLEDVCSSPTQQTDAHSLPSFKQDTIL